MQPNASLLVFYGSADNSALNKIRVGIVKEGGQFWQFFRVLAVASAIDDTLNTTNALTVGFDPTSFGFSLTASSAWRVIPRSGTTRC